MVVKLDIVGSEDSVSAKACDIDYESLLSPTLTGNKPFDSGNQVVHWVMHYPYPMYSREYCYVRRAKIDKKNNLMILVSRATDHPNCCQDEESVSSPKSKAKESYVRVTSYDSRMVIRPHSSFEEDGFDYLLTYFDDPQSHFPSAAYKWMAYSGVPDFVNKLYDAAVKLNQESKERKRRQVEEEELKRRKEEEEARRTSEEEDNAFQEAFKRSYGQLKRRWQDLQRDQQEWSLFEKYTAPFVMPFVGIHLLRHHRQDDYDCQDKNHAQGTSSRHYNQQNRKQKQMEEEITIIESKNNDSHQNKSNVNELKTSRNESIDSRSEVSSTTPIIISTTSSSSSSSSQSSTQTSSPVSSAKATLMSYFA